MSFFKKGVTWFFLFLIRSVLNHSQDICNLRYKTPQKTPVIFHNGSTYDYNFIVNELAKVFKGQFECLDENTEKYITFYILPIKKELDNGKSIAYKIKFIDRFRFISSSLCWNLSEGLRSDKCTDCKSYLDYTVFKDDQLIFRCFECKKNYKKNFNKELIERFANIYEFCDKVINKFILLLKKGVYPYE